MRRTPLARIIIASAALTLLGSSVVSAQYGITPPRQVPGVETVVVTSALDDAATNQRIEDFALAYHTDLGGKNTEKKNNGWFPVGPMPDTDGVVQAVLDMAAEAKGDVIVISGGDGQSNAGIARSFGNTTFIDLGQSQPCLTSEGQPDPSGTCEGAEDSIPFNYVAVDFAVEDGAYLSGVLAASASRNDRLGIISGFRDCAECNRYIGGFLEGARSVDPEIEVELAYLADDEVSGFSDPVAAKTFTKAFIDVFDPDVILPVGRGATIGMVEAACEAGKLAIGTGTDVTAAHPDLDCVLASVTKDVERALDEALYGFAMGNSQRVTLYGLVENVVAVTDEWTRSRSTTLPVDTAERYRNAEAAILTGQVKTCPDDCGAPLGGPAEDAGVQDGVEDDAEAQETPALD